MPTSRVAASVMAAYTVFIRIYREASCPASATRELEKVSVREKTEWLYCTTFWHFAEHCPQLAKLFEVGSACK